MHLWALVPRPLTGLIRHGGYLSECNNLIKDTTMLRLTPLQLCFYDSNSLQTNALTPAVRYTSPLYRKHSNRGVKYDIGVNNHPFQMRRFAREMRLFAPVGTIGLSPQKRKFPVSSCSVRSTKSRHRYFEDLRLWKAHSPVSCICAYHVVIERPSSSKSL